jgi:uncharacterized membrane protein YhhN
MKRILPALYLAVLAFHLISGHNYWVEFEFFSKPALLILLLLYAVYNAVKYKPGAFGYLLCTGLFFSLWGDIFLMFQQWDNTYFLLGLGSFLIAHILYTIAFVRTNIVNHEIPLIKRYGFVMIAVIGYGLYFFNLIRDHLGGMTAPVMLYTLAITLMLLMALNRYKKVTDKSFWYTALGAALFVASDSILAWNKFVNEVDHSHVAIMLTYGLAQYGIAVGGVAQMEDAAGISPSQRNDI